MGKSSSNDELTIRNASLGIEVKARAINIRSQAK